MFNLLIFVQVIKSELILLSQGDHYQEIFDIKQYEALSDCNETQIHIQEHHIIEQIQILEKQDIEQILYYPSDENIILILEKVGRVTILFKENKLVNSSFKELSQVNLNTKNLSDFTCSDMTQYSMEIFMAVCKSNENVYISQIICLMESQKYITGCQAQLYLDTDEINCDNLNIITQSTWRIKDPEYFSIYCSAQENFTINRQLLIGRINQQQNSIQFGKLIGAIYEIEKVSFFDDNTLMILDHHSGLHIYHFLFTDDGDIIYEKLLWQIFLPNEIFYALSYSHEQYGIRFPPLGIIENDIQYSIVILSDHFIYELALPHQSQDFFFTTLQINDKINIQSIFKNRKLKKGQIQYDEQFYYICLTFDIETECYRINRHQSYAIKIILINNYQHSVLMTYPVSFSTITGQTNILITQQINSTYTQLTLIRNEIERLQLQSLTNQEFVCAIVYKNQDNNNFTLMIYNQEFESTQLFKIDHMQNYNFPNTDSTVLFSTLIRGPAPILVPNVDKNNVNVTTLSGFGYEMRIDYYENFIKNSRIPIKTFLDKGFRAIFLQIDTVKIILQKEITNTHYFNTEIQNVECSSNYLVEQIVGISPYYMIFYQKTNYYTLVKIIDDQQFELKCQNIQYTLYDQDFEVFIDLDFINLFFSTDTKIYYTNIYFQNLITIDIDRKFRQLNFQFLKNNIILGSHQNKLYQIELINPYQTINFKTIIQEIELGNLTNYFKFFVLSIKQPIPTLVIIDERITLYTIENLQEIRFDSLLPQFNSIINPINTQINYHMLIVPTNKQNELYIYDLSRSGSDRLHSIHKYNISSIPVTISYPKKLTFLYCLQFINNAEINCYFNKKLEFELIASDPSNIDNQFQVNINANSALIHSIQKTLTINGSFRYQDTIIQKINHQSELIEIYKTNYTCELQILDYYQGPIFNYELSNQNGFKILPFIWENENDLVRFKINQTILGTSVSKEYLIILGDETISIINIPKTQCIKIQYQLDQKQVIQSTIDYEEINNVFFDEDQPIVTNCTKSFINTLSIAELSGIQIIALFCQSMMVRVNVSNQINQLSFTILSDNQPLEKQFLENFFFLNINYQDFLYQNQSSFILEDIKMINFPIEFKPKYKFITISAMVKANKRYEETQKDHIICIFYGSLDQSQNSRLKGSLLDVIGASNFNKNTLIVNNFQMYCISGCQIYNNTIDTVIELIFNDQYEFTLYQLKISFYYDFITQPKYQLISISKLNIKELMSNFVTNNIDFTYIDTQVQYHNDSKYTINVTTDSISFDLVQQQQHIEIEQIFKQYTQCQSPPGSLKASYHEYLAISCKNASQNYSEQTQFVKLFLRGQSNQSVKSVIQAERIQGNLMLLDIQKGYLNERVRMLILEQDFSYQEFQLRWFTLDSKFILQADQNIIPKSTFNLQLCSSNLNQKNGLCMDINISNIGYKHYITQEWILFILLIATPLIISISFIVYCIISYKAIKQKRVEQFGITLEQQLKKQSNIQSRNEDTIY